MSAHVEGSGTGVKFSIRFGPLPGSVTEKNPPAKELEKLLVSNVNARELNPPVMVIDPAESRVHE